MIFIVDDDPSVRKSLTRLMRSASYEARAFASAEDYLQGVGGAGAPVSCVILDIHMPGMSGLELQQAINHREPRVPVIVLTATEDSELRIKALVAGAKKVLRKPCESTVLLRAVAEALGQTADSRGGGRGENDPDGFVVEEGRGLYRPAGSVSFDEAVDLVRDAIAVARRNQVSELLVDTTALTGFASPDTLQRFLAAVEWAQEAKGGVRLAMVARAEMIHAEKFGVLIAANRGMVSNIFTTEAEARDWLDARDGR